jgi:hypothetical protein
MMKLFALIRSRVFHPNDRHDKRPAVASQPISDSLESLSGLARKAPTVCSNLRQLIRTDQRR